MVGNCVASSANPAEAIPIAIPIANIAAPKTPIPIAPAVKAGDRRANTATKAAIYTVTAARVITPCIPCLAN